MLIKVFYRDGGHDYFLIDKYFRNYFFDNHKNSYHFVLECEEVIIPIVSIKKLQLNIKIPKIIFCTQKQFNDIVKQLSHILENEVLSFLKISSVIVFGIPFIFDNLDKKFYKDSIDISDITIPIDDDFVSFREEVRNRIRNKFK